MIEHRTVELLKGYGLAAPILERGSRIGMCEFRVDGEAFVLDYAALCGGRGHYIYPQQELVGDWAEQLIAGWRRRSLRSRGDRASNRTQAARRSPP